MKLLDTTTKLFIPAEAERVAREIKANDPDWEYRVCHAPQGKGYSFIEVYDENGEFVSRV